MDFPGGSITVQLYTSRLFIECLLWVRPCVGLRTQKVGQPSSLTPSHAQRNKHTNGMDRAQAISFAWLIGRGFPRRGEI